VSAHYGELVVPSFGASRVEGMDEDEDEVRCRHYRHHRNKVILLLNYPRHAINSNALPHILHSHTTQNGNCV